MIDRYKGGNRISIEMAPMEGITTATFRRVYTEWFKGIDRTYTPFLVANQTHKFKRREKREVEEYCPALVPQILTDRAEHFIWAAWKLKKLGYTEVNLNAGCPSATVTTKKKGAGMLRDLSALRFFLDEVFSAEETSDMPEVSIKTRAGFSSYDETADIAKLYAEYPLSAVIVHPRIREDFYDKVPDLNAFGIFYEHIDHEKRDIIDKFKHIMTYRRARKVSITGMQSVCADGEIEKCESIDIEVVPKAINFMF